jgi:hypothetical protein
MSQLGSEYLDQHTIGEKEITPSHSEKINLGFRQKKYSGTFGEYDDEPRDTPAESYIKEKSTSSIEFSESEGLSAKEGRD